MHDRTPADGGEYTAAHGVTSGHQNGAAGRTEGLGVEVRELDALLGQCVDMRRFDLRVTMAAHLVVALIVRENKDDVGLLGRA